MRLKYGCNPHQAFAEATGLDGGEPPIELLNGTPSLINFLDALNAWQLVAETRAASGYAALLVGAMPIWGAALEAALDRRLPSPLLAASLLVGLLGDEVLGGLMNRARGISGKS